LKPGGNLIFFLFFPVASDPRSSAEEELSSIAMAEAQLALANNQKINLVSHFPSVCARCTAPPRFPMSNAMPWLPNLSTYSKSASYFIVIVLESALL
jgi:hypothetical protein